MPAYISEVDYKNSSANDFVEIAATSGADMSGYSVYVYKGEGVIFDGPLSLGSSVSTNDGKDVYVVDSATPEFAGFNNQYAVALVDDLGNVVQFVSFHGNSVTATEGPANGLTSTEIGTADTGETLQSDDGGSSYYAQSSPNKGTVPCYATGTLIDTPDGPRAVETLQVGDLVVTLDHGPQPIRWIRSSDHALHEVGNDAKPVLFGAGALGHGLPAQGLIVSPQHRILVGGHGQLDGWFKSERFAPAKSLTALPGVRHMKGKQTITWIHFACDRHEVVTANGCLSESLLLGPMVAKGLTAKERVALSNIYGATLSPDDALNGPAARACLSVGEVRQHLATCRQDKRRRTANDIAKWDRDVAMAHYEAERLGGATPVPRSHRALGAA
ncbi:Hint domain-containing protein [Roseivivax sp. CAU 1753]